MSKANFIVMRTDAYDYVKKDTGEVKQGLTVFYYPDDNLSPIVDENTENLKRGSILLEQRAPFRLQEKIKGVPGMYAIETHMVPDPKNRQGVTMIKDIEFLYQLEVKPIKTENKQA